MKKILKVIVLLSFLVVVGLMIFLMTLDVNQYKPAIIAKVSEQTGREFNIEGELEVAPSLSPTIAVSGISLANASWGNDENLLEVGRIEARISIIALLGGGIRINNFVLHDTSINLEKNAQGQGNWEFTSSQSESAVEPVTTEAGPLPPVSVDYVEIRNAVFRYSDIAADSLVEFRLNQFTTTITDLDTPVSFSLEADYNDMVLDLSGQIGTIESLTSGDEFPVDISGNLGELAFTAIGSLENLIDEPTGSVSLTLEVDSLSELNLITGSELPDHGPLLFSGNLNLAGTENISLEEIIMRLGEIGIAGTITVNTAADVPQITADLQSDVLDLSPYITEEAEEEVEFLFSRDPLPLETLASINADLTHQATRIITPSIELADNELSVSLNNGNLNVTNRSGLAGGNFSASLQLDTINNQARLSTEITGQDILLEHLPHEEDRWFTGGETSISISGSGNGGSVADIMGTFNGNILVQVGEATMPNSGIDMFGADIILSTFNQLNPLSSEEDTSLLECAVINLPVNDGIIKLDRQIAVQTSKMYMVGSGEINLKNEQINLGVRPYAKEGMGLNLSSVAGAAKIGGTLANPRPEVDAENVIKTGLSAGAAVATGGLSLLAQGLFSKSGTDPEPCNTALGIVSQTSTQSSQESDSQTSGENADSGNVVDDVKSTIKGLFGR